MALGFETFATAFREDRMSESDELAKLGDLHQRGVLSDDEFSRAKARVLSGAAGASCKPRAVGGINALRRSRYDRWLGGVCGGIGQVTETPAWVWRLLFTFLVLFAGTGVLVYVLLWLFVPLEPAQMNAGQQAH
jgi:phage shock protein PspC (stress-responsive transcriptional regulator)